MESKIKRQIGGALTCPMVGCWIIFSLHFIYIGVFHGFLKYFLSLWDMITDVVLLFSIEAIAVLITLSNSRNNYTFFKISFIVSIINVFLILFYIFLVITIIFSENKDLKIFEDKNNNTKGKLEKWQGVLLIAIKVIELLPLAILIVYMKKLASPVGTINPENIAGHIIEKEKEEDDDELLY